MILFNKKFSKWNVLYKNMYLDKVNETKQYNEYFEFHSKSITGNDSSIEKNNIKENKFLSLISNISLRYISFSYIETSLSKNKNLIKDEPLMHDFKQVLLLFVLEALSLKISTLLFQFSLVYTFVLAILRFMRIT